MVKDWTKIYKKYKGLWVALADDEMTVVGSGKKLSEALAQAKKKGVAHPIVMPVPDISMAYVGSL